MNTSQDSSLKVAPPRFVDPPVVETALGIQFDELSSFATTHFGLFYETIRNRYPFPKDQPRLSTIFEPFPRRPMMPEFKLQMMDARPVERVWFMDAEKGANLIQVQPDRFGFNWRKPIEGAQYPSYSEHGKRCIEEFNKFCDFCHGQGLGDVTPNLCEVVYVNHIFPPEDRSAVSDFETVFPGVQWRPSTTWLGAPEGVSLNRVYTIGENRGRLYAEASIASHKERGDFVLLKMVGRVLCGGMQEVTDSLQLAHDWVVKGFESLTDQKTRKERWGQTS